MRIAVIAALPGELKPLVRRGFRQVAASQAYAKKWLMTMGNDEWVAVCAGMGGDAARRAFLEAELSGAIDVVLSVGWAGALTEGLLSSQVYVASAVIDAKTGERFELSDGLRNDVLVTAAGVARKSEKRRLAQTYGGKFVDMEAATVVRLAQMRGIPAVCMKVISDDLEEELPDLDAFIDAYGQMEMAAFVLHVLGRPKYWGALRRLGRASSLGADALASAAFTFLSGAKSVAALNRAGNVDW